MSRLVAALAVFLCATVAQAQTYDSAGRLKTTAEVTNTSATVSPVASRLTDGTGFIVPVLDTTLTARFPVGSTPADNEANGVTITRSGAFMFVFDGSTWDRWTGAVTQAGTWTVTGAGGTFPVTGTFWPTLASSPLSARLSNGSGFVNLPLGSIPSDDESNSEPTTRLGTYLFAWDTTNGWDRLRQYNTGQTDNDPYGLVVMGRRASTFDIVPFLADGSNRMVVNVETGTLAATQSGSWTVQPGNTPNTSPWLMSIHDGTNKAAVLNLATNDPLAVAIVDGTGSQITSFGGGVQYTEGNTDASITGTAVMWEDTGDALAVASAAKPLPVNVVAGGAGDGKILDGTASGQADVFDYTNSRPLAVRLTDTDGNYVGAGAGTQYNDGAAGGSFTGTVALGRNGTDVQALAVSQAGELWVQSPVLGAGNFALDTADETGEINLAFSAARTVTMFVAAVVSPQLTITPYAVVQPGVKQDTMFRAMDGTLVASLTNPTNQTAYEIAIPNGSLNVGVRVSSYTSGSVTVGFVADPYSSIREGLTPTFSSASTAGFVAVSQTGTANDVDLAQYTSGQKTMSQSLPVVLPSDQIAPVRLSQVSTDNDVNLTDGIETALISTTGALTVQAVPITATGTITADSQAVTIDAEGYSTVGIQLSGTWTGTMDFQGTVDGTNWQTILFSSPSAVSSGVFGATANGIWVSNVGGLDKIRVFGADWVSGTVTVNLQASAGTTQSLKPTLLAPGQVTTDLTTINNGTAVAVNNGAASTGTQRVTLASDSTGQVKLNDGTDTALVSGSGSLQVTCDNCGGSTFADDDAFTGGTTAVVPFAALYDTSPPAITDGSAGTPRMTSARALMVDGSATTQPVSGTFWQATQPVSGTFWQATQPVSAASLPLPSGAATSALQDGIIKDGTGDTTQANVSGGRVHVDGSGVTQPVSGTFWQTTQPVSGTFWQTTQPISIEQTGNNNAVDVLTLPAVAISQTTTNNDVDVATFPDNEPFNLAQVGGTATVTGGVAGSQGIGGAAAHDGTTLPNPIGTGAFAETPEDSDANTNANRVSADADLVRLAADRNGTLYVRNGPPHRWAYHENSSTALTDTTVHASCGTGLYNYIESITASTGGATAFSIMIEDSTTATILGPYYLEAVAGRGLSVVYPGGRKQSTAATLISVTTTGAVAHGIDITGFCAP